MSSRITSLGLVTGSTNTQSSYIWTIWNGKDYKVSYNDLSKFVGRNPGLNTGPGTDVNPSSGDILLWGASCFYDELGWWDSNSVGIVQVKDDKVTAVDIRFNVMWFGTTRVSIAPYLNGTLVESVARGRADARNDGGYPCSTNGNLPQLAVSSGDIIDLRVTQKSGTNTIDHGVRTFLSIKPSRYK